MPTVLLHLLNEDPVMGEMENAPALTDTLVMLKHPRRRDGKDLHYLEANVSTVYWPMTRVNFIEIVPSAEEEEIISFIRE